MRPSPKNTHFVGSFISDLADFNAACSVSDGGTLHSLRTNPTRWRGIQETSRNCWRSFLFTFHHISRHVGALHFVYPHDFSASSLQWTVRPALMWPRARILHLQARKKIDGHHFCQGTATPRNVPVNALIHC